MLAIRMQRTGRKGHPMYRVIVQEAHRQPTSGRVVAQLGAYNPHTKQATLDAAKIETYLKNGAQPSERVVKLLKSEKISLPKWVKALDEKKQKSIKNAEKLRRNRPAEEPAEEKAEEAPAAEVVEESAAQEETLAPETTEEAKPEAPVEEAKTEAVAEEKPAEETSETEQSEAQNEPAQEEK